MKAVSHRCQLSDKRHQAANNGGKPGRAGREKIELSRRDAPLGCGPESLGSCEVGITALLLLAEG